MKKVLVALVMAGLMTGSLFADVDANVPAEAESGFTTLVYGVASSMKGWEFTSADANFAASDSVKANGYVIFDVNNTTLVTANQVTDVNDPNKFNNTTFIALGSTASFKKAFAVVRNGIGFTDPNVVVMQLATVDQPIFTTLKKGAPTTTKMVDASFAASSELFDMFTATSMFGKLGSVKLDTDDTLNLPKSLKACGEFETFDATTFFLEDDLTGNIKLTLNTKYTKDVDDMSVFTATAFIAADLVQHGYTLVSIDSLITSE